MNNYKEYTSKDYVENNFVGINGSKVLTDEQKRQARDNIGAFGHDWHLIGEISSNKYYLSNIGSSASIIDWDAATALVDDNNNSVLIKFVSIISTLLSSAYKENKQNFATNFIKNIEIVLNANIFQLPVYLAYKYNSDDPYKYLYFSIDYNESKNLYIINNMRTSKYIVIRDGILTFDGTLEYPDTALSISGRTADAKAVGDALATKITTPATASVDQTIVVKSVDENGKPTEWKAVDMQSGPAGEDGVSVTHSWDGTILTITSASGTSSADLKGNTGETGPTGADGYDGYTPVRGTDYWTDEDKTEIVDSVVNTLSNKTEIILMSSTEGSTKQFKITVDDSGTLTATEIVEETTIEE